MAKQKIIGITTCTKTDGLFDFHGADYAYVRRDYAQAVRAAGAMPILLTPDMTPESAAELCDGIVISGGYDIPVELYDGQAHESMEILETMERIGWDMHLIDVCTERNVPILGICYGMQLMNIRCGGSLYQDIPSQVPNAQSHSAGTPVEDHLVTFSGDFLGFKAGQSVACAPRHHQAINRIADGWEVMAMANDGVIEAIQNGSRYGVQWHAESDDTAVRIYGAFIDACDVADPLVVHETVVTE